MITNKGRLLAVLIVILVLTLAWGVYIVPKQLDFVNECKSSCSELGWDTYQTKMFSYPVDNLNARCFCVDKQAREFVFGEVTE